MKEHRVNVSIMTLLVLLPVGGLLAGTTVDPSHPSAYGSNIGWIDARGNVTNGASLGHSFCTGYVWSANCGWICLGNGPTNGWRYSNASATDWGVNHDGEGRLSGYAWGANIGWVIFEQTNGLARIDLRTGNLSGYAWGANVGWIGLSNSQAYVRSSLSPGADTDGDGIPDAWEMRRAGNLTILGVGDLDADNDGTPDAAEYVADTDPLTSEQLEIAALTSANGTNVVTWTSRPTRLYAVEATNALPKGLAAWTNVSGGLIGPPPSSPSQAAIAQAGATSRFYRVRAVVPLAE